jgi:hypothetical protein
MLPFGAPSCVPSYSKAFMGPNIMLCVGLKLAAAQNRPKHISKGHILFLHTPHHTTIPATFSFRGKDSCCNWDCSFSEVGMKNTIFWNINPRRPLEAN